MYVFKFLLGLHFIGGVLVPFYLQWGKISFTQIMILQSVFVFSIFLLEIPTGAVADYFGRKVSLIFGSLGIALGVFVYSSTPNFYMFLLAEIIWAAGYALMSGADQALVYDTLKKIKSERTAKKVFGRLNSCELVALTIGAPIGSVLASTLGLRMPMLLMLIPSVLAFILAFFLKEPEAKEKAESKRYLTTLVEGVRSFKNNRGLRILSFDMISISAFTFFIIWMYQPRLQELGLPILYLGLIHAAITGIQIPFTHYFETLESIFKSKRNYLKGSALVVGVAFIGLGLTRYLPAAIAFILIIAGFGLSRSVLFQSYMNKHIESHNRATVLSSISMTSGFVRGLMYPFVGLLVEWSISYTFIIIGVLILGFTFISQVQEEHLQD